jgi:hypothetical protein
MREGSLVTCWLAQFDTERPYCMMRQDGNYDRCHLIDKQRIRVELRSRGYSQEQIESAIWDSRIWRPACRAHHVRLDSHFFSLKRDEYPPSVEEWANEHGFFFLSPRRGWVAMAAGAAANREAA